MFRHPRLAPSCGVAHRSRFPLAVVILSASALACGEKTPTEMSVELPLVTAAASVHTGTSGQSFAVDLSQEVTATSQGDPDGVGTALLTMNAGLRVVCWSISAANIALPATASHIHHAPAGLAGPVVLPLTPPGANGTSSGCAQDVSRDLIVDIFTNPTGYYVNVHTTEHPPGAIRSQLQ